jgi:hypothetical protein
MIWCLLKYNILPNEKYKEWLPFSVAACLAIWILSGCAHLGPSSLNTGRSNYIEAINKTEDEQILSAIVRGRYGETSSLLAVNGVAANVRFATNAGINVGFGPADAYEHNLVPFSGGVAYEENPTITYAPVHGAQYLRQLLSPIPLDILVLFLRSGAHLRAPINMLVRRINDMPNPDFLSVYSDARDRRFQRFCELDTELSRAGVVQWVADSRKDVPFDILITGYAPGFLEMVREYLALLGAAMPADVSKDIVLPVRLGIKSREISGIAISTRSTFDLVEIFRAAIEVPQEHVLAGITVDYPPVGLAGKDICIP